LTFASLKVFIYCLLIFLLPNQIFGQIEYNASIGIKPQYGFLVAHRPSVLYLAQQHVPSVEIFYQQNPKSKSLNEIYNTPKLGYALNLLDFRNSKYLGKAISLDRYVEIQINRKKGKIIAHLGAGVGCLTKSFDRIERNKNIAIGSKLNMHLSIGANYEREVGRVLISCGFVFNHYSNGSFKTPNLGLNVPALQLGAGYIFSRKLISENKEKINFVKCNYITINSSYGIKETYDSYDQKFSIYTTGAAYNREISPKSILIGGLDIIYNQSLNARIKFDLLPEPKNKLQLTQLGVNIGYGLKLNNLHLVFQSGFYAISQYKGDGLIYSRLSSRYYMNDKFFLLLALKTHFAKADYGEIGLGIKITGKNDDRNKK
jgi:Lipid A 3-O-deacylase (PagL)